MFSNKQTMCLKPLVTMLDDPVSCIKIDTMKLHAHLGGERSFLRCLAFIVDNNLGRWIMGAWLGPKFVQ